MMPFLKNRKHLRNLLLASGLILAFVSSLWYAVSTSQVANADEFCDSFPTDPSCPGGDPDPCAGSPDTPECNPYYCNDHPNEEGCADHYCEQNPTDPDCQEDPCAATPPPDTQECNPYYCNDHPNAEECADYYCQQHPDDPECQDDACDIDPSSMECYCQTYDDPVTCNDPCNEADPPDECDDTPHKYCEGSGACEEGTTSACNADFSHQGDPDWAADDSLCDCSCYDDDDPTPYCSSSSACNYEDHDGDDDYVSDDSTCQYEYYCPDPTDANYTDPSGLTCPQADSSLCQGIPVCNNSFYCEGEPACNYDPELANTPGHYSDDAQCYCQNYCPDPEDANYTDPSGLTCPQADSNLCAGPGPGCPDSAAVNYDPNAEPDMSTCQYLNSNVCQYQAQFSVAKINPDTENERTYSVGVIVIETINTISDHEGAAECPVIDEESFIAEHYAFIYDILYPSWPDFDSNGSYYSNLGESEDSDICPNIDGTQDTLPVGYVMYGSDCITENECVDQGCSINGEQCDCNDMCPNIAGIQDEIPVGYYHNDAGDCVTGEECEMGGGVLIDGVCHDPVNGVCAAYEPDPTGSAPTGTLCQAGDATEPALGEYQGEESYRWLWSCEGQYGGSDDSCNARNLCGNDEQFCSTNSTGSQCIAADECCTGFMMCSTGCTPYSPSGCGGGPDNCDTSVSPPICTDTAGTVSTSVRVWPPVADIETNLCALSFDTDIGEDAGEVTCDLTLHGVTVGSYGPDSTNASHSQDLSPGEYRLSCVRESTLEGVDEEGNDTSYVLRETDQKDVKCAKNPNFIEF